jgi:hypothetical protein
MVMRPMRVAMALSLLGWRGRPVGRSWSLTTRGSSHRAGLLDHSIAAPYELEALPSALAHRLTRPLSYIA